MFMCVFGGGGCPCTVSMTIVYVLGGGGGSRVCMCAQIFCAFACCTRLRRVFILVPVVSCYCDLQAACWSPDGNVLVFAMADDPALYYLTFFVSKTGERERQRQRETQRERQRERDRERDREKDRERETERDRERETERDRQRETETETERVRERERERERERNRSSAIRPSGGGDAAVYPLSLMC